MPGPAIPRVRGTQAPVLRARGMGRQRPARARSVEVAMALSAAPVAGAVPRSPQVPDRALAEVRQVLLVLLVVLLVPRAAAAVKRAEHLAPAAQQTAPSA